MSRLLLLLLLGSALCAGENRAPRVFFRRPDARTRRQIKELINQLNASEAGDKRGRIEAREALVRIGPWSVALLNEALTTRPARVKQNAVIALGLLGDPRALPALRGLVESPSTAVWVGRTACLVLAYFHDPEDGPRLIKLIERRKCDYKTAATLALAKFPGTESTLRGGLKQLPRDGRQAAATLLAAVLVSPDVKVDAALVAHPQLWVREAAATCLLLRPLPSDRAVVLLDAMKGSATGRARHVRALQLFALASMRHTPEIREQLRKAARREKGEAQRAALIGLAYEAGHKEDFEFLRRMLRGISSRNDPRKGPVLFALARTRHPDAKALLEGLVNRGRDAGRAAYYAAGSLLFENAHGKRVNALLLRADDPALARLAEDVRKTKDPERRLAVAREGFRDLDDLWTFPEDRKWMRANELVARLLDLSGLVEDRRDPTARGGGPVIGGKDEDEEGRKPASGTPEEADLSAFLNRRPLFGPEDLRGVR